VAKVLGPGDAGMPTIGYARVCSHDREADLVCPTPLLEAFCAAKGWRNEVIAELGFGLKYRRQGLHRLLELLLRRGMRRLMLTHKDPLLRFGWELIFALCKIHNIEIVIINKGAPPSFEQELSQHVIEIMTVSSARSCFPSKSVKYRKRQ
jgi:putative resolvase